MFVSLSSKPSYLVVYLIPDILIDYFLPNNRLPISGLPGVVYSFNFPLRSFNSSAGSSLSIRDLEDLTTGFYSKTPLGLGVYYVKLCDS